MKVSHLKEVVRYGVKIGRPILISGIPGIGKSTIIRQVAKEMDGGFIDIRASSMAPEDVGCIPYVHDGMVKKAEPSYLPTDKTIAQGLFPKRGIILFDEINDVTPAVASALYEVILDRKMGTAKVADGWWLCGAGNRQQDRASATRTSTALANRFIHITLDVDHQEVIAYAQKNDWHLVIPAFLNFRPAHVSSFDPKNKEKAFASPRTWEYTSDILKNGPPPHLRLELLSGTIGEGIAIELEGFIQVMDELMSWQTVLKDPDNAPVPVRPAAQWAMCTVIAQNATVLNLDAVVTYAKRMTPDMGAFLMMSAINRDNELLNHTAVTQRWAPSHGGICGVK